MSSPKKVQEQELKKLEDEAYFELCQIIAEAMQYQDVDLLNARIAYWKNKYKKLLAGAASPDFKKRIEFLLNQYYSSVTQYILSQLQFKEKQKIKNQAKAMQELYHIIKNTKDLSLLKQKIEKWKAKYPVSSFLDMYQKRIRAYTRQKNLEENAFLQEQAFKDLVDITKKYGTFDELNEYIHDWENKYSINNNFTIDDFIKHQSEVKRFVSPEFLQSIAREYVNAENKEKKEDLVEEYNNRPFSDLSVQALAYANLLSISKSSSNVDEMFKWVYKNSKIKFNDKYKEMILRETYLYYSPTYLKKLDIPDIDFSSNSLSFEEYSHIDDIKRYAIISYFNLLLPPNRAVSNDFFSKNIYAIYSKSEKYRTAKIVEPQLVIDDILPSGIEIPVDNTKSLENCNKNLIDLNTEIQQEELEPSDVIDLSHIETVLTESEDLSDEKDNNFQSISSPFEEEINLPETKKEENFDLPETEEPVESANQTLYDATSSDESKTLDSSEVIVLSPLFFIAVNNLDKQAKVVDHIETDVENYMEQEKSIDNMLYKSAKIKSDE